MHWHGLPPFQVGSYEQLVAIVASSCGSVIFCGEYSPGTRELQLIDPEYSYSTQIESGSCARCFLIRSIVTSFGGTIVWKYRDYWPTQKKEPYWLSRFLNSFVINQLFAFKFLRSDILACKTLHVI